MHKTVCLTLLIVGFGCVALGREGDDGASSTPVSSLSYPGHKGEQDTDVLVSVYPELVGTRIDDCQTCHAGGMVTYDHGDKAELYPCTYCHLLPFPNASVVSGAPADYAATLNAFGRAYKDAGRDADALREIAGRDADGDSHTNGAELSALRYPGDPRSLPGQPIAPSRLLEAAQIQALADHAQFLLLNSTKQRFDSYATYRGVPVKDLLEWAGADLSGATSISFIAPDGFTWDCPVAQIRSPFPRGLYHAGLDPGSFSDPDRGLVQYPPADRIPAGLVAGTEIPVDPWMLIAYERDGAAMDGSYLDAASGHTEGEGPYRLIVPQAVPGSPDRGTSCSPSRFADGFDFDHAQDHNAGFCVRGLVAVRVNPLPEGYEEFDWKNGGWSLIEKGQLLLYGAGVSGD